MKALRFNQHGDPGVLFTSDLPAPAPSGDEAVVQVFAASINPSDVKNVEGRMSQTTLPRTPGRDYSGVVIAGPAEWLGAEVWGSGGDVGFTRDGTHAEQLRRARCELASQAGQSDVRGSIGDWREFHHGVVRRGGGGAIAGRRERS